MLIGNGRLGGTIFGGGETERIQLNEDGLWTGDENPSGAYGSMGACQTLLTDAHEAETTAEKRRLTASSKLGNGLRYEAQVLALSTGHNIFGGHGWR